MIKSENKTDIENEYYFDNVSRKWVLNLIWDGNYTEIIQKGKIK